MQFGKEFMRQNSFYKCVINEEETDLDSADVFELAFKGKASAIDHLSRKNLEHLSFRDENGASPLHYASAGGHLDIIRLIVSVVGPEELNVQDEQGRTPLHWAVEQDQLHSCALLLELGADPNILNSAMMGPLHLAVTKKYNHLVEVLLQSCDKTDANLEGDLGNTPVMLACCTNNCDAIQFLFKHGAKMCIQNKLGHYAIHTVAFAGAKEAMELVLKIGEELGLSTSVHINYLDKSKSTPLHLAVRGGNIEVIKLCIIKGARVDQQQCDKSTALHFACTQGALEAVKIMLSSYNKVEDIINIRDGANQTPLHRATLFDHVELVEYLISKEAEIDCIDCNGLSPLLMASRCGAWKTVAFLLSIGADFRIKDKVGCNFLHFVVLQPKGLKNLPETVLQSNAVKEMLSDEDVEGCTPLHYACKLGIHDSVKNMLGLNIFVGQKSREKKSALHFAAEYGRINTCKRLLETLTDSKMLNDWDEKGLTPLHLASMAGHTQVVELLLRSGALFQSDYKGWSCLHHAAAEGYTETMKILLAANVKLLDETNEDGNTALHIAAQAGHVSAVMLLLDMGAEISLNNADNSFLHEAVRNEKKDVVNAVIESERCGEAIKSFKATSSCPVMDIIEFLPESFKHLLDRCILESDHDANSPDYHIKYDFQWLQAPIQSMKYARADKAIKFQPLAAMNAMVRYNRLELLTHPVSRKYLEMKWKVYGSKVHLLNLAVYLLGLLPLTYLILNLRPKQEVFGNNTSVIMVPISFREQKSLISVCIIMVLVFNVYSICKELVQLAQQRINYFTDFSNPADWGAAISSLVFVIPMCFNLENTWQWEAGAFAILTSWIAFLLYFQRFERIGIYVVMFGGIVRTLLCIMILFIFLLLAFGLAFYALMLHQDEFSSISLALAQTFVMTVGELNYQSTFQNAYENGRMAFPGVTYFIFVIFVLLMPILLMNLMIGLAVGDIAEVQRNAELKRIAMQIDLHTALEKKLPYWFLKRVDKPTITIYPNKCKKVLMQALIEGEIQNTVRTRLKLCSRQGGPLERELHKQKNRLKAMSCVLEKQHNLLKLIIQKMEITSEADEYDGPHNPRALKQPTSSSSQKSKWVPLLQAIKAKK
ncbi:transient receptor potential cation channel subfamily A member 1-like [Cyprinus carpio]|uniref:Transient receptor potential cation channel subfamily A member 1-like n=1 Tax=Cyprinus carpio TaxID=7962 RepID=A0A9Q9ZQF4_CYPCA|nr:transient receptor potential cation channel subfamily A member 1-like [Cyprinus carpio]XP_042570144.1 transient receptor potential cation channel subfamily A member 1-like [Cyprinus carpio]XP_042570145.1 transient receptor potential cation channel subfamily A member 1-like [Cyprinus carpio]XP_042570146.1 transient receptor potential cation channel subfamily A member 1-like [Cyprinus carpio]